MSEAGGETCSGFSKSIRLALATNSRPALRGRFLSAHTAQLPPVYATCLFCHAPLGRNDAVEHFPVGRRLAFDAAKGRLWVVCSRCARWNLTPLEERWEAVEECERLFERAPLRASTDQVGLARITEGTELVRIGAPGRPELAAWRYGDQFVRRRRRAELVVYATSALAITAGIAAWVPAVTAAVPGVALLGQLPNYYHIYRHRLRVYARVTAEDGTLVTVRRHHLDRACLYQPEGGGAWRLRIAHERGLADLTDAPAARFAGTMLAAINAAGGTAAEVRGAVARLDGERGAEGLLRDAAARSPIPASGAPWWHDDPKASPRAALRALPAAERLALEMALHEEEERLAMEGELAALERAWREAEEIAAIADDLMLPAPVQRAWERLRQQRRS